MTTRATVGKCGLVALAGYGLLMSGCAAPEVLSASAACKLLADKGRHVGETITFPGDYTSDHMERAVVWPTGCRWGIGVRATNNNVKKLIEPLDPPWGHNGVRGRFTGKLVQSARNGMLFFHDDGIRLNIIRLDHAAAFEWTPRL